MRTNYKPKLKSYTIYILLNILYEYIRDISTEKLENIYS